MLPLLFHLSVLLLNAYGLWYDQNYVDLPFASPQALSLPLKGRVVFVTIWCFIVQMIYFAVSALNDVFGTNEKVPRRTPMIRKIRDTIYGGLAFPAALYITTVFWSIYTVDRELIFPEKLDDIFPGWLNHVFHTTVLVFMFVELYFFPRNYPSKKVGTFLIMTFSTIYLSWMVYMYYVSNVWVYPLFDVLNWPLRISFIVMTVLASGGLYLLGEKLDSVVWSHEEGKKIKMY